MRLLAFVVAAFLATSACAENVVNLRVATVDSRGYPVEGYIPVTIYRPAGEGPFPAVIVSHGRPGMAAERARMGRVRLASVTTTLLGRDMVVLVPTRLGYGLASGGDPEYSVSCEDPEYERAFSAGADQVGAVVQLARSIDFIDPDRIYLIGHSVGGGVTSMAASRNLPGVRAAVNFSGSHGGNPLMRPGEPCRPDVLQETFARFGRARTAVPQLWVYPEDDEYIAPRFARQWFSAYVAAGGRGELKIVPNRKHSWFAADPFEWRDLVMEFFGKNGLH